jgi:hypothetical protein
VCFTVNVLAHALDSNVLTKEHAERKKRLFPTPDLVQRNSIVVDRLRRIASSSCDPRRKITESQIKI